MRVVDFFGRNILQIAFEGMPAERVSHQQWLVWSSSFDRVEDIAHNNPINIFA